MLGSENLKKLNIDITKLGTSTRTIKDYQVIGFDVDHTLGKYNLKNLHRLLQDVYLKALVETLKYPQEVFLDPEQEEFEFSLINRTVVDLKTGNLVKLDKWVENKVV